MPLYEYHCAQCGYRYEKIQKFNDEPEVVCPKCGGELQRPLTAPALQFKGAGWYVNDYAPKGTSGTSEKPAGDAGSSSSESKPGAESKSSPGSKPAASESASKPAAAAASPASSPGSTS